jgi:hypothetical protein
MQIVSHTCELGIGFGFLAFGVFEFEFWFGELANQLEIYDKDNLKYKITFFNF